MRYLHSFVLTVLTILCMASCGDPGDWHGDVWIDTAGDTTADPDTSVDPDVAGDTLVDPDTPVDTGTDDVGVVDGVQGTLHVDFTFPTLERARGVYLWLENPAGAYVDTVQQYWGRFDTVGMTYGDLGYRFLNDPCDQWRAAVGEPPTGPLVTDGVTGASVLSYSSGDYTSETWDLRDSTGGGIPAGTYTVYVEITFDGVGHPILPVHHYSTTIDLGGADTSSPLAPLDEKVSAATVVYDAP